MHDQYQVDIVVVLCSSHDLPAVVCREERVPEINVCTCEMSFCPFFCDVQERRSCDDVKD